MPKSERPEAWRGFTPVYYTQIPDEFFDVWLPHLSGAECKILCYLLRHTLGWKRTHDRISLGQMTNGIVRRDGVRLDGGAGVSRGGAQLAIDGLVAKGLIAVEPTQRPDGGHGPNRYYVRMADQPTPYTNRRDRGVPDPIPLSGIGPSQSVGLQETDSPNTNLQEGAGLTAVDWELMRKFGLSEAEYWAIKRGGTPGD
jgi:hypothetical protein